jgi:WD40-like Beta Propeller Repeat
MRARVIAIAGACAAMIASGSVAVAPAVPALAASGTPSLVYLDATGNVWAASSDGRLTAQLTTDSRPTSRYLTPSMQDDGSVVVLKQDGYTYVLNPDGTTKSGPWIHPSPESFSSDNPTWADAETTGNLYVVGQLALAQNGDTHPRVSIAALDGPGTTNCVVYPCPPDLVRPRFIPGTQTYLGITSGEDPVHYNGDQVYLVGASGVPAFWFGFTADLVDILNVDVRRSDSLALLEIAPKVPVGASATSSELVVLQPPASASGSASILCSLDGFGNGDSRPRWSPDGTQIAFTRADGVHVASAPTVDANDNCVLSNDHLVLPGGQDADWSPYTLPASLATTVTATATSPSALTGAATVTYSRPITASISGSLEIASTAKPVASAVVCRNGATVVGCSPGPVTALAIRPLAGWVPGQSYRLQLSAATGVAGVDSTFRAPTLVPAAGPGVSYQWAAVAQKASYGGTLAVAGSRGATASLLFSGPTLTWFSSNGPTRGVADVYVDGQRKATVNEYATTVVNRVPHALAKLGTGKHVLTIKVRGSKGSRHGTGTSISVDALRVGVGKVVATPAIIATWSSGTRAHGDTPGEAATVAFAGTGISWTASIAPASSTVTVYLDGKKVKAPQHTLTGLKPGVHKLRLLLVKGSLTLTSLQIA